MKMQKFNWKAATTALLLIATTVAQAQPLPTATRTVFLERGPGNSGTPMNVAFHPDFQQYYGSPGGTTGYAAWTYDLAGLVVDTVEPLNLDVRTLNYNANTGLMEVMTYNALGGGTNRGLMEAVLDGTGFFTGGVNTLLATVPGNASSQSMPAYDPVNNVYYSRSSGNTVNVVSRGDGTQVGTITLDTAAAGAGSLSSYPIGYSSADNWLIVTDTTNDTAIVFDLSGNWLGTSALDIDVSGSYGMGFANGQLFVWDYSQDGWQGFDIGATPGEEVSGLRFRVSKRYADDTNHEIQVTLTCNGGLPLEQDYTLNGGDYVTFTVTEVPDTGIDCMVTESGGPAEYEPIMNAGTGCEWTGVTQGIFSCSIINQPLPVDFSVSVDWEISEDADEGIGLDAAVMLGCWNGSTSTSTTYDAGPDEDGPFVLAGIVPPATCSATMDDVGSVVVVDDEDCADVDLEVGDGEVSCTITATAFFEGIPTLGQWGMAIMALLMLGVGFVGMRRIA